MNTEELIDFFQTNFSKVGHDSELSKTTFNEKYAFNYEPVVIDEVVTKWTAYKKWDLPFFKENFGDKIEISELRSEERKRHCAVTVADYIDYLYDVEEEYPLYLNNCQFHWNTSMEQEYDVPEYLNCWYHKIPFEKRKNNFSWIYLAAKNSVFPLHLDIWNTSAWNAVLSGKKLWVFFKPSQHDYFKKHRGFDPFDIKSYDDPYFDDPDNYPSYSIQNPGELAYTPSMIWHAVMNLEKGVSLTENFVNETNYQHIIDYFNSKDMKKAAASMSKIVEENLAYHE